MQINDIAYGEDTVVKKKRTKKNLNKYQQKENSLLI